MKIKGLDQIKMQNLSELSLMSAAVPCDVNRNYLPPHTPPLPFNTNSGQPLNSSAWESFNSRVEYDFTNYHFVELQSSATNIDKALGLWVATVMDCGKEIPWANLAELYQTIDAIQHGDALWKTYQIHYQGPCPPGTPPKWMTEMYQLCAQDSHTILHNQLVTSDFHKKINYVPYCQFNTSGECVWSNLMSADWSWSQAVSNCQII
jgi:Plavaka transposase